MKCQRHNVNLQISNFLRKSLASVSDRVGRNGLTIFPGCTMMKRKIRCFASSVFDRTQKKTFLAPEIKKRAFITEGFSNWKKAVERLQEHQSSKCHQTAMNYNFVIPKTRGNVLEMPSTDAKKAMQCNRKYLIIIIECLQYLSRQGQSLQNHVKNESNFVQLLKWRTKDNPSQLIKSPQQKDNKYISHDIQNEICAIMNHQIIGNIVEDIGVKIFSIIADEYTDISNKEQLTLCLRWIDDNLEAREDFLGFYNIPNINADTIVSVIKDVLMRIQLSWSNCRGQCYNGASNMLCYKSGVAKHLKKTCYPLSWKFSQSQL